VGRDSLGQFEQLVLLAVVRLNDGAYAVSIMDEIEQRTGRPTSHAAVHVALKRMEKKGLVLSRLGAPTSERGGRAKRYYEHTPLALEQLTSQRDALLNMWDGVEAAR
jgi:DNA-binding PadR family transcriptional regulator